MQNTYVVRDESEALTVILAIEASASSLEAIPAPPGLTIEDLETDIFSKPGDAEFALSTAELWQQMVLAATNGEDVRNLRKAMGFTQSELARRWGCNSANICIMEKNNGKLASKSWTRLARVVAERIVELS